MNVFLSHLFFRINIRSLPRDAVNSKVPFKKKVQIRKETLIETDADNCIVAAHFVTVCVLHVQSCWPGTI